MRIVHETNQLDMDFPFVAFEIQIEAPCIPHWHKEIEIAYVKEGSIQIGLGRNSLMLNPGDMLIIDRGQIHSYYTCSPKNRIQFIQFDYSILEEFTAELNGRKLGVILRRDSILAAKNHSDSKFYLSVMDEFSSIFNEYVTQDKAYRMMVKGSILKILAYLVRNLQLEKYTSEELIKATEILKNLSTVFNYINENFEKNITLQEISELINYSPYYFTRFFKNNTGMTFIEYLNRVRIEKAETMLINQCENITEIAFMCGFNSLKTFNRVFKATAGCSPSSFRLGHNNMKQSNF